LNAPVSAGTARWVDTRRQLDDVRETSRLTDDFPDSPFVTIRSFGGAWTEERGAALMAINVHDGASGPGERLELGKRIKELRLKAGVTLRELGRRLGWVHTNLTLAEAGSYVPSDAKLAAIAHALGADECERELRGLARRARAARRSSREGGFGAAMAMLRRRKGWTLTQLARRMGWSRLYAHRLENGNKCPAPAEIGPLAALLEGDRDRGLLSRLAMLELGAISIPIPAGANPETTEVVLDIASAFAEGRLEYDHPRRLSEAIARAATEEAE
jgi:transcriptional regulator with XRE-family HTH domain